jgi:hypothetical protein
MSDPEGQKIDFAPGALARIELLDAEIELGRLEAVSLNTPDPYSQLSSRREELEIIISACRVALAPHKKLPAELLAEIFLTCSAFPDPSILPPKSTGIPLVLTHVSRTWRELALQLSELWANISIIFDAEGLDVQRVAEMVDGWLSRASEDYPLNITAECTGPFANALHESPNLLSGFMAVVFSNAHRMRHLDLAFPSPTLRSLFEMPSGTFLRLETLHLRPRLRDVDFTPPETGYCGWHWPDSSVAFDSAPVLREVVFSPIFPRTAMELSELVGQNILDLSSQNLDGEAPIFFAPTVSLPWSQLRFFSFLHTACTPAVWCSILLECPNVVRCELGVKPGPRISETQPEIHLECLDRLYLFGWHGASDVFLESLVAPRLKILMINGQIVPSTIARFQTQSRFELDTFSVEFEIGADDAETLFQDMHDTKDLFLLVSTEHFYPRIWDRVCRGELLPQLRCLVLHPRPAQMPVLVDFIASSWERAQTERRNALRVILFNVLSEEFLVVNEGLKPLEKYAEAGNSVEFITV